MSWEFYPPSIFPPSRKGIIFSIREPSTAVDFVLREGCVGRGAMGERRKGRGKIYITPAFWVLDGMIHCDVGKTVK